MKNEIVISTLRIKNHIKRYQAAYAAGTVAVLATVLLDRKDRVFGEFLESKGIDPMEYFFPEYYEELNPMADVA